MATVQDLLIGVRYRINDTDSVEYTDAELIDYVNEALQVVGNELCRLGAEAVRKRAALTLTDGSAALPSDFVREVEVKSGDAVLLPLPDPEEVDETTYAIEGGRIYSGASELSLLYCAALPLVSAPGDTLPLPDFFAPLLRQMVVFIALNRNEFDTSVEQALLTAFQGQILSLARLRGHGNFERPLPFRL